MELEWVTKILGLFRDFAVTVCALITACVAFTGLRTWRKELHGRNEYEVARKLLRAVYGLRNAFNTMREPIMTSAEKAAALDAAGVDPCTIDRADFSGEGTKAAYAARWNKLVDAWERMEVEAREAQVLWGDRPELNEAITEFKKLIRRLKNVVDALVFEPYDELNVEEKKAFRADLYDRMKEGEDEFTACVNRTVEKVENVVRRHIRG